MDSPVDPHVAGELLEETERLSKRVRSAPRPHWFPLVLFGVLVLGATPFYWQSVRYCTGTCGGFASAPLHNVAGPMPTNSGIDAWASVYWLAALAVGLLATARFYHRRANRCGVDIRVWPVALAGTIFAGLLVASSPAVLGGHRVSDVIAMPDLHLRGTTPILLLALVLLGLALVEHSWELGAFAVLFVPIALLSNLYDLENFVTRLGWWVGPAASNLPNVVIPALVLFIGGAVIALLDRWSVHVQVVPRG